MGFSESVTGGISSCSSSPSVNEVHTAEEFSNPPDMRGMLSVVDSFDGATVFLTGVTGFVGSLVLEQILRVCESVRRVYVLARDRKDQSAQERIDDLLHSGVFNMLWDSPKKLAKVHVIQGDISEQGLGISNKQKKKLMKEVDLVIHSAASVVLEEEIHRTLIANYWGTKRVMDFCQDMKRIQAFTHVSTAFVNINHKQGSVVKEEVYPLYNGDETIPHEEMVEELMRMTPEEADDKSKQYMLRFNFPNTYCLGKHLAEHMVYENHMKPFPVSIVRPSLVGGVSEKGPYPGYVGNMAGAGGICASFGLGFFEKGGPAWYGNHVTDLIPADTVSSLVIAATAETQRNPDVVKPVIYHACSSTTYPISNHDLYCFSAKYFRKEPPPFCLLMGDYPSHAVDYKPVRWRVALAKTITWLKVMLLCIVLQLFGKTKVVQRLKTGYKAWNYANSEQLDMNLFFSSKNVRKLDEMLCEQEKKDVRVLWTPKTEDWRHYFDLYYGGIKCLLLRTPLKDPERSKFKIIPNKSCAVKRNHKRKISSS